MINEKIPTLSREQELKLLKIAKNSKNKQKKNKAIRSLIAFNQPFVKYIVHCYPYNRKEIDPRDLVNQGIEATFQAINSFDLEKAEKRNYRFATYAGYWINQYIQAFILQNQLLPRSVEKSNLESKGEDGEKKTSSRYNIVYYDSEHQSEKDDKASLLMDTLSEKTDNENSPQKKNQVNKLLTELEPHENLIIRLFFAIIPSNFSQIYPLANNEQKLRLEKLQGKKKLVNILLTQKKNDPLVKKCLKIFSVIREKEEVAKEITKEDFWQYFSFHFHNKKKNKAINQNENEEWLKEGIEEKAISNWIDLGYQPKDAEDPSNRLLQNIGVSKKDKEKWLKVKTKAKNKNWLDYGLEKLLETWKKKILTKLQEKSAVDQEKFSF